MKIHSIVISLLILLSPLAMAAEVKTVAVLDTELRIDNKPTPHSPDRPGEIERAGYMTAHIRKALDGTDTFQVVSNEPAAEMIEKLNNSRRHLHYCNTCIADIGKKLGVDYVASSWVQVVSNLIVNLNLVLYDARTGKAAMTSFIDIRGNNNSTWNNGTNFLLEQLFREYYGEIPKQALKSSRSVWPAT